MPPQPLNLGFSKYHHNNSNNLQQEVRAEPPEDRIRGQGTSPTMVPTLEEEPEEEPEEELEDHLGLPVAHHRGLDSLNSLRPRLDQWVP